MINIIPDGISRLHYRQVKEGRGDIPEPILPFSVTGMPVNPWVLFTFTTSSTCK
jgi:hypothetical protein